VHPAGDIPVPRGHGGVENLVLMRGQQQLGVGKELAPNRRDRQTGNCSVSAWIRDWTWGKRPPP
jgi:hypothetical protein